MLEMIFLKETKLQYFRKNGLCHIYGFPLPLQYAHLGSFIYWWLCPINDTDILILYKIMFT